MAINDWQNDWKDLRQRTVSQGIREQGDVARRETSRQTKAVMEGLKSPDVQGGAKRPDAAKTDDLKRPQTDAPKSADNGAVPNKAEAEIKKASERYQAAKKIAEELRGLERKAPVQKSAEPPAVQNNPIQKTHTNEGGLPRQAALQNEVKTPHPAKEIKSKELLTRARSSEAKDSGETTRDAKKTKETQSRPDAALSKNTDEAAKQKVVVESGVLRVPVSLQGDARRSDEPSKSKDSARDDEKKASVVRAGGLGTPTGTKKELNALLGGFSGSTKDSEGGTARHEPAEKITDKSDHREIPKLDPGFKVFSEFDESRPGVEEAKSRAQVLSKYVIQEVVIEAASLEEKLASLIEGLPKALVERIVGEHREEFKEELITHRFQKNVYGGIFG